MNLQEKNIARVVVGVILFYLLYSAISIAFFSPPAITAWGFFVVTLMFLLVDGIKGSIESLAKPDKFYTSNEDLKKVTVIVPCYNAESTLQDTLSDLKARFENQNIIVSANGCTDNTIKIAKKNKVKIYNSPAPIGKVRAINEALQMVKTPYVLIIDDDVLLGKAKIPTGLLDEGYGAVAFRVLPLVKNLVTKIQKYEYRKSMDVGRAFFNKYAGVTSVSGAIGLFKLEDLVDQINTHTGEFSGEDLQRTLRVLLKQNSKGVVICDSIVYTDVPDSFTDLFYQRVIGWFPATFSNIKLFLQLLVKKETPIALKIEGFFNAILIPLIDPFRLISIPFVLFAPSFFIIFYVSYVALETVSYVATGKKDPYWIVLLWPFYGIFNLVARITSMVIFFYRRLAAYFSKAEYLDDYRIADIGTKISAASLAIFSVLSIHGTYAYLGISSSEFERPYVESTTEIVRMVTNEKSIAHTPITAKKPKKNGYVKVNPYIDIIAESGDSMWSVTRKAVLQYEIRSEQNLSEKERTIIINKFIQNSKKYEVYVGKTYRFKTSSIKSATYK